jgi:hypothetical protein
VPKKSRPPGGFLFLAFYDFRFRAWRTILFSSA